MFCGTIQLMEPAIQSGKKTATKTVGSNALQKKQAHNSTLLIRQEEELAMMLRPTY